MSDEDPVIVDRDAPCQRCGYNVRGLPTSGRCPECAAPVSVALHEGDPNYFDPKWLLTVHRAGQRASVGFMAGGIAFPIIGWLEEFGFTLPLVARGVVVAAIAILAVRYLWDFATPNPVTAQQEAPWSARRITRIMVVVSMTTLGVSATVLDVAGWRSVIGINVLLGPFGLAGAIGAFALAKYCEQLGELLDSDFVVQRSRVYRNCYIVCWPLTAVGTLGLSFSGGAGFACALAPGAPGVLGFGILILALPSYLAPHLDAVREVSQRHWAEAEKQVVM